MMMRKKKELVQEDQGRQVQIEGLESTHLLKTKCKLKEHLSKTYGQPKQNLNNN